MDPMPHILVVDDQRDIREPLGRYLDKHGLRTSLASSATEARDILRCSAIDLVILDIMMPGEDGLSLCRHLREAANMPIILLTAMADDADRIAGLEVGADDYVVKPFNPRELLARIKAVLRRATTLPRSREANANERLAFDRWIFDVGRREVVGADGVSIPLSTAEFRLLSAFVQRPRMVLTRDQLVDLTSGRDAQPFDRSIDNQVSRLRKKLEADPKAPGIIKTVWGGGYVFSTDVKPA
ncbi:response regulator [Consotaella aegiceratis]|uniref:response regulator n=1 Tax=Consotaella aegiceratis TaxID=3097961 RepID=UPI002F425A1C